MVEFARIKAAIEAKEANWKKLDDLMLDVRVAERDGDADKIAEATKVHKEAQSVWHDAHLEAEALVKILCEEIGITRYELRGCLN